MGGGEKPLRGPDLEQGVKLTDLAEGVPLLGHAHGEAVLLARRGDEVFAVGATCTHYSGPLAEGLIVDGCVRCPWHHGRFDLRTGEPHAPALNPIACYKVERRGDQVIVRDKITPPARTPPPAQPEHVVIVGAGAAGNACAETLRREGHQGRITMIGAEDTVPVDRPNLSKDYLAGSAPEEWIPLRSREFYREARIELTTGVRATALDTKGKKVTLSDGRVLAFDALVLATGATPVRLDIPGADRPHVHYLRTLADSNAIISRTKDLRRAVVLGGSFIGLEVAASLRARNVEVHVVAPGGRPLERVLGAALGDFVRALHEQKGVRFHLGRTPAKIGDGVVTLDDGSTVAGELVVAGIGVRPNLELATQAGLTIDRGVVVDELLQTSAPGIFAVGDIARWPDPRSGSIRVEHWVLAERQGLAAARNLLGRKQPFREVPFFWSQHYDVPINYVGHCEKPDAVTVHGSVRDRNCVVAYRAGGKVRAAASIYRDLDSLAIEAALERDDQAAIEKVLARVA
jgi:NADPH-dependent 2,4-dienoyl-CoA reductase/sulfur reductase-like enzyme/nitrite reductase/ring-hydroxylating ferredoxin subunit